jgi:hypothetical protein
MAGTSATTPRRAGTRSPALAQRLPRAAAVAGGVVYLALGVWALVSPRTFFVAIATFEPYNQHFLQDAGAFQIGLGVVLLLAGLPARADALTVALTGVGVGTALHAVSHLIGRDLGGVPERDIPALTVLAVLLLGAGLLRWRWVRDVAP